MIKFLRDNALFSRLMNIGIRRKITLFVGTLVAGISLFLFIYFPKQLTNHILESVSDKATTVAEMLAYSLGPALDFGDPDDVSEALEAAIQFEDVVYVYVLDQNGDAISFYQQDSTSVKPYISLSASEEVSPDGSMYSIRRPIDWRGRKLGELYMGFSLAGLHWELRQSRYLVAFLSLLILIIGEGVAYLAAYYLTKPLERIARTAEAVSKGDWHLRAKITSKDEIGVLAESFNYMLDSLHSATTSVRQSEEKFRAVIEHISDIVILVHPDFTIKYISPSVSDALGFSVEDVTGTNLFDYIHPDDRPDIETYRDNPRRIFQDVLGSELRTRHADGTYRHISYCGKNLIRHRDIKSILISARDTTEQTEAGIELQAALNKAEEMVRLKDAFLSNMSHEIRTPITGILGAAELLEEDIRDEQRSWLEMIQKSGNRLMQTLNSVLDLAQLQAQSVELRQEEVDVVEEVNEIVSLLKPIANEGVNLCGTDAVDPVRIYLDRNGLQRILYNLIGNALKFTQSGSVHVAVEEKNNHVHIEVRDTGIGISKEFLNTLFDEFRQESTGLDRSYEGNGLGLSITKRLTHIMGGSIDVQSIKGTGSVFTVIFPQDKEIIMEDQLAPTNRQESSQKLFEKKGSAELRSNTNAPRVLLVEDNLDTTKIVTRFADEYVNMTTVTSSEEAIRVANEQSFDLVLMDINLGDAKDGISVMHELREGDAYKHVPFIAVTAYALPDDEERLLDIGFDAYIGKPFRKKDLLEVIKRHLPSLEGADSVKQTKSKRRSVVRRRKSDKANVASSRKAQSRTSQKQVSSTAPRTNAVAPPVLLVEDNPDTTKIVERFTEDYLNLSTARNAEEAIQTANEREFDLVLMDINLGDSKDGICVMKELRDRDEYKKVPFIAVTAYALPGEERKLLEAGFDACLSKPFRKDALRAAVNKFIPGIKIDQSVSESNPNDRPVEPTRTSDT